FTLVTSVLTDHPPAPLRYSRLSRPKRFDHLSGTVFDNHHQPLLVWITCLYLMGLNLSGLQIARELGIDRSDARAMIAALRQGIVDRTPPEPLSGEVECDEVYVVAGHKGPPEGRQKKGGLADEDA